MVRHAGDTVNEARYGLLETIRQNPVPAALAGIGLGWLWMNRRSAPTSRQFSHRGRSWERRDPYDARFYDARYDDRFYYGERSSYGDQRSHDDRRFYDRRVNDDRAHDAERGGRGIGRTVGIARDVAGGIASQAGERVSDAASTAQETVGNLASSAQETVSNLASSTQETASQVVDTVQHTASEAADRVQDRYSRLEDRVSDQLQDNPLVIGAIALALGTAAGLALPSTAKENELMGDMRDTLIERVQDAASDTMGKVQHVAGEVAGQAQELATEAVGQAKETVNRAAKEQGLTT